MNTPTTELSVLYQDPWVIVVDKPPGVSSQATRNPNQRHLVEMVGQLLNEQGVRDPYVALHHRLDRDTSGAIILAIHPDANEGLSAAFRNRIAQKTYICVCDADPLLEFESSWSVTNRVRVHPNRRGRMVEIVRSGGVEAETDFEVLGRSPHAIRVQACPHTGRTHQIRVHAEASGIPIVGDPVYRRRRGLFHSRVLLHAHRLQLPHPVKSGETLDLVAPEPADMREFWAKMVAVDSA
jgi:RluA family pseudouridine synthase